MRRIKTIGKPNRQCLKEPLTQTLARRLMYPIHMLLRIALYEMLTA